MKTYLSPVFDMVTIGEDDTIRTSGPLQAKPSYDDDNAESGANFNDLLGFY